jgi:hypothetical protein
LISAIGADRGPRRIDLGQIVGDGATYSFVVRGLDPRIHQSSKEIFTKQDGLPGQARQ